MESSAKLRFDTLVIGGGIGGLQAALDLADHGYKVAILEKDTSIGGKMIRLSKVFPTLDCASCITTPKMAAASHHENITVFTDCDLNAPVRKNGRVTATVTRRPRMERLLAPHGPYNRVLRPSDGMEPDSISFVQCAGSRDKSMGISYCSRFCCMYAIKQAMLLSGALPFADIRIYYMGLRAFGKGYVNNVLPGGGFPHIKELITLFLELGGKLKVCVPCIIERNIEESDLMEGAETTAAAALTEEMLAANRCLVY